MFGSVIFIYIIISIANKHLGKEIQPVVASKNPLINYYPFVFHSLIVILLLISCFSVNILNGERIHALINDGLFQLSFTTLILMVSLINPFLPISANLKSKIDEGIVKENQKWLAWFLAGKNWQYFKLVICAIVVWIFLQQKYLVFPDLNQGPMSGLMVSLIILFIVGCIVDLFKNPNLFRRRTLFRLSMLYRSFKTSLFISIALCAATFISVEALDLKVKGLVNYEGIVLFVYNIVMAYNEFRIIQVLKDEE